MFPVIIAFLEIQNKGILIKGMAMKLTYDFPASR